jgi:hypothetical protein
VIDAIWKEYDKDKSGNLDIDETRLFMQDGLKNVGASEEAFNEEIFLI